MEFSGKYVNEQTHQKGKKFFNVIGVVLFIFALIFIAVGVTLLIVGISKSNTSMSDPNWFEKSSSGGFTIFGGIACIILSLGFFSGSIAMFVTAHKRELFAFGASTILPVANDVVDAAAPMVEKTAKTVGKSLKPVLGGAVDGVKESRTENAQTSTKTKICSACGAENSVRSKYCKTCGKLLAEKKYCKNCGDEISPDEKFCEKCGTKVGE